MPPQARPAMQRPAAPAPRPQPGERSGVTLPFPIQRARHETPHDEPARLRSVEPGAEGQARTLPVWVLALMVVIVAAVACLAAYMLLRP
jgi:hypothetical protein